jgi:signal transduction histidine kinase
MWILLNSIFLIIFNVLFFLAGGTSHPAATWISYGFIHFAYIMLLIIPVLIRRGKSVGVFGFSLYSIASVYFIVEFIIGLFFILTYSEYYKIALCVQIIIAGLYGIIFIANMIAKEHTADAEEKRQYEIAYVKDASAKLKGIMENISDKEAKKKVERVYDAVYSSPVKSHPNLGQTEFNILQSINELEDFASKENKDAIVQLSNSLLSMVNERNMRLKTLS